MSGVTMDEQIAIFRHAAAQLWARQAHTALGVSWERFLEDQGITAPESIRRGREPSQETDPGQLPGFEDP